MGIDNSQGECEVGNSDDKFTKKEIAIGAALLILLTSLPTLIVHFGLFSLPGMFNNWFDVESSILKIVSFGISAFITFQLSVGVIIGASKTGGPGLLFVKFGFIVAIVSVIIRCFL